MKNKFKIMSVLTLFMMGISLSNAQSFESGKTLQQIAALQKSGDNFSNMKKEVFCTYYDYDYKSKKKEVIVIEATAKQTPDVYINRILSDDVSNAYGTWRSTPWETINATPKQEFINKTHVKSNVGARERIPATMDAPNMLTFTYTVQGKTKKVALFPSGFYVSQSMSPNASYVPGC